MSAACLIDDVYLGGNYATIQKVLRMPREDGRHKITWEKLENQSYVDMKDVDGDFKPTDLIDENDEEDGFYLQGYDLKEDKTKKKYAEIQAQRVQEYGMYKERMRPTLKETLERSKEKAISETDMGRYQSEQSHLKTSPTGAKPKHGKMNKDKVPLSQNSSQVINLSPSQRILQNQSPLLYSSLDNSSSHVLMQKQPGASYAKSISTKNIPGQYMHRANELAQETRRRDQLVIKLSCFADNIFYRSWIKWERWISQLWSNRHDREWRTIVICHDKN